jgi:hypothetical protein
VLIAAEQLGDSDCEALDPGWLAQPVNTLTSLAYVAAGLVIVARGLRFEPGRRLIQVVYGATLVFVGVGSVAYHGPQPAWARFAHDLSIVAILLLILAIDVQALAGMPRPLALALYAALVLLASGILVAAPDSGVPVMAVAGLAAAGAEVPTFRRGLHGPPRPLLRRYTILGLLALAGVVVNAVGRTGGALCDADSVIQLHGLWHVLTATVFTMWAWIAFPTRRDAGSTIPGGRLPGQSTRREA